MAIAPDPRDAERRRIAEMAVDLTKQRGEEVTLGILSAEAGLARRRLEQLFADDDELFDAMAALWFEDHIAIMEDVIASELPPNRKMYEFFLRRFRVTRERYLADPAYFAMICEQGAARFERVRSYVDLADHYLCEVIAQAQADGFLAELEIDEALSLINQMVSSYTMPEAHLYIGDRLTEEKLARIIDAIFIGLSGEDGGARGVNRLRIAN
ncbi:MAG: hypothetical protein APF82_06970 [Sphingomonadales bacterium BRH_c42]|nr:MAG: hypothetical protein APF82_06970 [Sphingomonadales bacterium BRH_c42]